MAATPVSTYASAIAGRRGRLVGLLLVAAYGGLLVATLVRFYGTMTSDHYIYLADAFLHGRVTVDNLPPTIADQIRLNDHAYLQYGPLPGVLSIPAFLIFGYQAHTIYTSFVLTAISGWLLWRVLVHLQVAVAARPWLLLFFFFGTPCIFVMSHETPALLAQMTVVTCLLAAILVAVRKPGADLRLADGVVIGLLVSGAMLSRLPTVLGSLFFITLVLVSYRRAGQMRRVLLPLSGLVGGLGLGLAVYLAYNYLRFGSILESGWTLNMQAYALTYQKLSYGVFDLRHVPTNFFYMFLKGPEAWPSEGAPLLTFPWFVPSQWGMSLLLTSPLLVYVVRAPLRAPLVLAAWAAILPLLGVLLTYFWPGGLQLGYRYALDFLPFVAVLLAVAFKDGFNRTAKVLVVVSLLVCYWGNLMLSYLLHI